MLTMLDRPARTNGSTGGAGLIRPQRWGVILAGGDGVRLRPLTQMISGDERPKQFCPVLGRETLLEQTRRRVARSVSRNRTLVVVTRAHERFYGHDLATLDSRNLLVQPASRGTAPAILFSLLRIAEAAANDLVAIFPSDHFVSDDARFMAHVEAAFDAVAASPEPVILLGIAPDTADVEYGWIEPSDLLLRIDSSSLYRVRRFWEKPPTALARTLRATGCLWNSFVIVARVAALMSLIEDAVPDLADRFSSIRRRSDTALEAETARSVYARIPPVDFSSQVLAARPGRLAVLPVSGVSWSDLGNPGRVLATLRHRNGRPHSDVHGRAAGGVSRC
jgi:mannose-1-phosphate guanylyltransferase